MATPKKNTQYKFSISLVDSANRPYFRANPTLAAGDVKVKTDAAGTLSNIATLPTGHTARYDVDVTLSAGEMNGDEGTYVVFHDAAGGEWDDLVLWVDYDAYSTADLGTILSQTNLMSFDGFGNLNVDVNYWSGTSVLPAPAGFIQVDVGRVSNVDLASHAAGLVPADVKDVAGTPQTGADLGAEATAIKAKTDQLTFTVANQVDARVPGETMVLP